MILSPKMIGGKDGRIICRLPELHGDSYSDKNDNFRGNVTLDQLWFEKSSQDGYNDFVDGGLSLDVFICTKIAVILKLQHILQLQSFQYCNEDWSLTRS